MGDTKEINLQRGLKLVRIIAAALTGLFFVVAFANVLFFQEIKVYFQTGADAQQIESIKIKKGSDVKLPTPLKQGSYFLGWSLSPDSAEILQDSTGLMQDTTLYAVWDGSEKYAVLSVNGMPYSEVNIFDTSVEGLTGDELNFGKFGHDSWRVLDDYALDNENVIKNYNGTGKNVDLNNNFSRFMGWQYLNQYNTYNELRYEQDARGNAGKWTWVKRDEDGQEIEYITIDDEHKFYPPNYRTTFTALLDYRTINIQLWDSGANSNYTTFTAKLGEKNVTLPVFKNDPAAHFSHWEIVEGALKNSTRVNDKPELASLLGNIKKRYAAGETLKVLDPLWYYYGSKLVSPDGKADLQVYLRLEAVYWDNTSNYQYTVQPFTDLDSGTTYKDFGVISKYSSDFNVENPVAYDSANQVIWLYDDRQIFSYSFYDHKGVYHILDTARFNGNVPISIGGNDVSVLGEQIYLIDNWGVNIMVNYQSSAVDVTVKFNYGDGLYVLPDYHYENTVVKRFSSKIGNSFDLWSGEKYVKSNYIFTGWKIAGDSSEHLYCAGEKFTISNFDTQNESTVIEFVADWHLQRLLFDFDFDGGSWQTEEGPDFTLMKGTYPNRVRIVAEKPVKFGYDFVGWTLENGTQYLQPNEFIYVGSKFQTLHAHWTETRLHVNFSFKYDEEDSLAWHEIDTNVNGDALRTNGVVDLSQVQVSNNRYYTFNGWQIGNQVITERQYQLTVQALSQLEWEYDTDENGAILEVYIRAAQTKRTLKVKNYNFDIAVESGSVNISHNVDQSRLETVLTQGDYFYNYYPFSEARINGSYAAFNTAGRQFVSWYYDLNGRAFPIDADTTVPYGVNEITVYGSLGEAKPFEIVYNFNGNKVNLNSNVDMTYYGSEITLPNWSDFSANGVPETDQDWGTFVGWSFEPDVQAGNPSIIYDVYNHRRERGGNNPLL